ncbi:hypothetical protein SIAM614_10533 [Stappia aggregata IAM 12614]|uniref:Uncharacterized protein n=1 Tax=Roseibium aggregatum (strain ATCC 25650 / DSM 13394 / JCM 20685 / NBRC 16684 / NCIMB 2208 / IAM 12614 / B1) TaxID=384765 RepID=A0NMG4_ROSAI|nr:hypothetical protein SIAM614_10533 [Stappia aggregata IAM 12614] [Roseibium aggregatum IAM 12614]
MDLTQLLRTVYRQSMLQGVPLVIKIAPETLTISGGMFWCL